MRKSTIAILVLLTFAVAMIVWVMFSGTWDDKAALRCQQQYGPYTYHPTGEQLCVLRDGTVKGLLP